MRYTPSHEWIEIKEGLGTVGITNFAQKELGEIVFIQLPKVGALLKAGEEACVLESTKAAADVYSPASGKVVAVNEELAKSPSLLNKSPESAGWLFKLALSKPEESAKLLSQADYQKLVAL
jgi:glycine cleavage system H protein